METSLSNLIFAHTFLTNVIRGLRIQQTIFIHTYQIQRALDTTAAIKILENARKTIG